MVIALHSIRSHCTALYVVHVLRCVSIASKMRGVFDSRATNGHFTYYSHLNKHKYHAGSEYSLFHFKMLCVPDSGAVVIRV